MKKKKKMTKDELLARLVEVGELYHREMYEESPEKKRNLKAMAMLERFLERQYPSEPSSKRRTQGACQ